MAARGAGGAGPVGPVSAARGGWWWLSTTWVGGEAESDAGSTAQATTCRERNTGFDCDPRPNPRRAAHPGGHAVTTTTHHVPLKLAQLALPPGESASGWGCHVRAGSVDRCEQARGGGFGDAPSYSNVPSVRRLGAAGNDAAGESASGWRRRKCFAHGLAGSVDRREQARGGGFGDVLRPTQTSCPGFWKVRRLGAAGYDIAGESASGWRCRTRAGQARAREAGWTVGPT